MPNMDRNKEEQSEKWLRAKVLEFCGPLFGTFHKMSYKGKIDKTRGKLIKQQLNNRLLIDFKKLM